MDLPKLDLEDENQWGVGRVRAVLVEVACSTPTRAPSARAARTTARPTARARTCRRCSSSTTSATRCSTASPFGDKIAELEARPLARGLREASTPRPTPGCDDAPPPRRTWCSRAASSQRRRPSSTAMPKHDRRPDRRGHAVGVHDVRRVPGGVPGVHRAPAQDHRRCARTWCSSRRRRRRSSSARSATSSASRTRGASATISAWTGPRTSTCRLIEDHPDPEYILWVGCAGAFDSRIIKQTRAMVKVLEHRRGRLRGARPQRGVHRRSGAPRRQRDAVPDARRAERRDPEGRERQEGRHQLPALPAHAAARLPAVRRQLRGRPPHPADRPPAHRTERAQERPKNVAGRARSRTTTAATSAAGTASSMRRAT